MPAHSNHSVPKPWEQLGHLAPDPLDDKTATASLSGESLDTGLAAGVLVDSLTTAGSSNEHQINPSISDIKTKYHPHSKQPPDHIPLNEYRARKRKIKTTQRPPTKQPWKPFQTRAEFKFAEVALKASLTKNQVNSLIEIMKHCINGEDKFEINNHAHLCEIWNAGAILHPAPS